MFDAACRSVRLLRQAGVRTTVNFTPMRHNRGEAVEVIDLAENLGANKINMTEYVYLSRGGLDLMMGPGELQQLMNLWLAESRKRKGRIEVDWHDCRVSLLLPEQEAEHYSGCGAGYTCADHDMEVGLLDA